MDPVERLLKADEQKQELVRELGRAQAALIEAATHYRDTWKATTNAGWATSELTKAGFTSLKTLPRSPLRPPLYPSKRNHRRRSINANH